MISVQTGQRLHARMTRAELREHEIRLDLAQGPVPACLRPPGWIEPPPRPVAVREPVVIPSGSIELRPSPPSTASLPPVLEVRPLCDIAIRREAVAACLARGGWWTVREVALATRLHPEVVRAILRSSTALSRRSARRDARSRRALIEYSMP